MTFDWNKIQTDWLFNLPAPYTKEEIVKAFNKVERRFGSEFFDRYKWIRGTYIVTLIVDLSKILEETERGHCRLPENGEVIQKIKENNLYLASTLVRLAAYYLRHGISVEFDPELIVGGRRKHPDLRVEFDEKWVYIEESKLNISSHQKYIDSMLLRVSNEVTKTVTSNLNIEISLLKDHPSAEEVNRIIDTARTLCGMPNQPQESDIGDLAQIFTYEKGQEKPSIEEIRPALCMATLRVGNGVECHFNMCIPFTDVRIAKILKERKQLSPNEHNMIILDVSSSGNLKKWSEPISRILEPNKHRRIGAVLLVEKLPYVESFEIHSNLIVHPNPSSPLPKEFLQLTRNHFEHSSKYYYRPQQTPRRE